MKTRSSLCIASATLLALCTPAQAHFQLLHTPQVNIDAPQSVSLQMIFWHPMENGHAMDMGKPEKFFYVFKDEKVDLMPSVKPFVFQAKDNQAKAFVADVPIKRNGDYIFVLQPEPYFEKSEDVYIQQITKSFLNKGQIPSGWEKPVGLPTEIVPFNKPTNVLAGSTFTGQVLSEGKPAAGVEIEVEYMAAPPDGATRRPASAQSAQARGGSVVAVSDANGMFTLGIPKAGFWGFAALGSGPQKQYKGKELSQDAVLWIRADDLLVH